MNSQGKAELADVPSAVVHRCLELAETILGREPEIRIFVFGSRATGQAHSRSDIDLGIDAGHPLSAEILDRVQEALDSLPILQKVECVDFARLDEAFKSMALRSQALIYERTTGVSHTVA